MNPRVTAVQPQDDHTLLVTFENEEKRLFDAKPYLERGVFQELKDLVYFKRVKVSWGAIVWPNEQDLSHDTLYLIGEPVAERTQ
ncbi:MAG: DUF2442 domain-containing protein [Rhodothermales bacterium]|nr:DUF2442 domain-containing protein [Rhodothermales bacterium]